MNTNWLTITYQTLIQQKQYEQALNCLKKLQQIEPENPEWWVQMGNIYLLLNQEEDAVNSYEAALENRSQDCHLLLKLCQFSSVQKHPAKYEAFLKKAVSIEPQNTAIRNKLTHFYAENGEYEKVATLLVDFATTQQGYDANLLFQLFQNLKPHLPYTQEKDLLQALLIHAPFQADPFYKRLFSLCLEQNQLEDAIKWGQIAYTQTDDPWYLILCLLDFPDFNWDAKTLQTTREQLLKMLQAQFVRLRPAQKQKMRDAKDKHLFSAKFYCSYQGLNDRPLMEQIAQIFLDIFNPTVQTYQSKKSPSKDKPVRVGVVSHFFYNHAVSQVYFHHYKTLADDPDFELICLAVPPLKANDDMNKAIQALPGTYTPLPNQLELALETILEQTFDILLYTEIGMNQFTYQLALHRLAPLQYLLPGHPVTSGLPEMDYYISSHWLEQADLSLAQTFYTEKLFPTRHFTVNYPRPRLPENPSTRKKLGLPEQGTLYLCPVTLFKLHPDFDSLIKAVLAGDAQAQIVFFAMPNMNTDQKLLTRLDIQDSEQTQRIHFSPWLPRAQFLQVLTHTHLILDPLHFGLNSTTLLAFALGVPIVTWPTPFKRSRCVVGMYGMMGVENPPVVSSEAEYIELALRLGKNPAEREALSQEILAKNHRLFEQQAGVDELLKHMKQAVETYDSALSRV